ncbi:MAG: HU family DNA-binding protein [Thermosynechococcaceae cyanobacterium]
MNKAELVDAIAVKANVAKKEADSLLNLVNDIIVESISADAKVTLVGFSHFEKQERKAKEGRNPRTREAIRISVINVPAFSAGKSFKDSVAVHSEPKSKTKK